ncbi:MAG: hypothetical protein ACRDZ6_11760 [Acidimicrobiales bacterium]
MPEGSGEFLSDSWFEALDRAVKEGSSSAGISEPCAGRSLRLGQVVTGVTRPGPGLQAPTAEGSASAAPTAQGSASTEIVYLVRLGGEAPGVTKGSVEGAEVTLVTVYGDAAALASGAISAGDLLEQGRIKIRGDARRLGEESELLAAVGAASAAAMGTGFGPGTGGSLEQGSGPPDGTDAEG